MKYMLICLKNKFMFHCVCFQILISLLGPNSRSYNFSALMGRIIMLSRISKQVVRFLEPLIYRTKITAFLIQAKKMSSTKKKANHR